MENATKALLMAAGVLFAIVVVSLLVIAFNRISKYYNENTSSTQQEQVVKFNEEYGSYATENLRGNDLLSLVNKVVDYNKRKSSADSDIGYEGKYIAYTPLTIKINFNNKQDEFAFDPEINRLILDSEYEQSDTKNVVDDKIMGKIENLNSWYSKNSIQQLASNITSIFQYNNNPNEDKEKKQFALEKFKQICPKLASNVGNDYNNLIVNSNGYNNNNSIYDDVKTYYEFMQLKKGLFNGQVVSYDENTVRITEMYFEFTGKIQ